ncbi:MAG: ABC transporter permease [Nitratireductor sp.]|nr:ABC transporter permease [Nitratireductor sp.]
MPKGGTSQGWRKGAGAAIAALFILAAWQAAIVAFRPPPYLLPSPGAVARVLVRDAGQLVFHAWTTLGEMLLGLGVGAAAGIAIALVLTRFPAIERFAMPAIVTTQTLPVFAIAPLIVIWFGFGIGSKIAMAALIIFFPVASAFHDGLKSTDASWLDLARGWGASPAQTLLKVRIPAALPSLSSGLKIAATLAPIGAIVGEWAGASGGLGYVMLQANARVQTDLVFACLFILALSAFMLRYAVSALCDRLVFWRAHEV